MTLDLRESVARIVSRLPASWTRYWRKRSAQRSPSLLLAHRFRRSPVVALLSACIALALLIVVVDPWMHDLVRPIDPGLKQAALHWAWIGKANWMLTTTSVACLSLLVAGLASKRAHTRVERLHLATILGFVFWAIAAPGIVAATLKQAIGRTRPFLSDGLDTWNLHPWSGFDHASMPSGDVCNAAALAVALSLLFPRYRLAFAAFAVLIATGRLVSERHYLSDVLVGAALGATGAYLVAVWLAGRGHVFRVTTAGALQLRGREIFRT